MSDVNDPRFIPEEDAAAVDAITDSLYPTKPVEDRSGLLLPAPAPPAPKEGQSEEDAAFAAVMGRYFPGSIAS